MSYVCVCVYGDVEKQIFAILIAWKSEKNDEKDFNFHIQDVSDSTHILMEIKKQHNAHGDLWYSTQLYEWEIKKSFLLP